MNPKSLPAVQVLRQAGAIRNQNYVNFRNPPHHCHLLERAENRELLHEDSRVTVREEDGQLR